MRGDHRIQHGTQVFHIMYVYSVIFYKSLLLVQRIHHRSEHMSCLQINDAALEG